MYDLVTIFSYSNDQVPATIFVYVFGVLHILAFV
jgi:hypothetical protein